MAVFRRFVACFEILEPEDTSILSDIEKKVRKGVEFLFRVSVGALLAWNIFDFLFSSVWMHGYIWSLNLPIDLDMSDKSAGAIVYHQMSMVGPVERIFHAVSTVLAISTLLLCGGVGTGEPRSVWYLLKISMAVGLLAATVRPLQLKQRLFSSLHEGFYCYLVTFLVGLELTLQNTKMPSSVKKEECVIESLNNPVTESLKNVDQVETPNQKGLRDGKTG